MFSTSFINERDLVIIFETILSYFILKFFQIIILKKQFFKNIPEIDSAIRNMIR